MISPGAVATELPEGSSDEATRKNLREFYKATMAIPANSIAYAIEQPAEVEIDEIVIRPTAQDF
jgi:NADP-dependent 3-hydroxy acid dehydrogenase YdfG